MNYVHKKYMVHVVLHFIIHIIIYIHYSQIKKPLSKKGFFCDISTTILCPDLGLHIADCNLFCWIQFFHYFIRTEP